MENETLKIVPGAKVEVMFLKDEPDVGISRDNRPFNKYTFGVYGTEKVFWATDNFHDQLVGFQAGDRVTIEHKNMKSDKGAYTQYFVHADQDVLLGKSTKDEGNGTPVDTGTHKKTIVEKFQNKEKDRINDIHRQVAVKIVCKDVDFSKEIKLDEYKVLMRNIHIVTTLIDNYPNGFMDTAQDDDLPF